MDNNKFVIDFLYSKTNDYFMVKLDKTVIWAVNYPHSSYRKCKAQDNAPDLYFPTGGIPSRFTIIKARRKMLEDIKNGTVYLP